MDIDGVTCVVCRRLMFALLLLRADLFSGMLRLRSQARCSSKSAFLAAFLNSAHRQSRVGKVSLVTEEAGL